MHPPIAVRQSRAPPVKRAQAFLEAVFEFAALDQVLEDTTEAASVAPCHWLEAELKACTLIVAPIQETLHFQKLAQTLQLYAAFEYCSRYPHALLSKNAQFN
jgi:hypothetical protein